MKLIRGKLFIKKQLLVVCFAILLSCSYTGTTFAEQTNYTYNYDIWGFNVASPDAYFVGAYMLGSQLGITNFRDPQGLFVKDDRLYICDSGNNRIVHIRVLDNEAYELIEVISDFNINGEEGSFRYPSDLFETDEGYVFVADTNNQRLLKFDSEWNCVDVIEKPVDSSISETADFLPTKLVVDSAGRVFVQARNVNKGLIEFDSRGDFTGYMGANKVEVNMVDYVWKMISTQAQRAQMDLFIPTEYNNLCIDAEGFIYVTNASGQTDAVRRLNAMGNDILIRNGYEDPIGDWNYGSAGGISGASKFIDVAAFDNDSYVCLDRVRGRMFVYDFQGNLLYAFGGLGNREGYFQMPVALDNMGYSLFVLDSSTGALTRLNLTEYGMMINAALNSYKTGRYDESAQYWENVLKLNGNYDLAYIGIGRAALRQEDYQKAMKYFKLKRYDIGYGKAFQLYRKEWIEENLWKILLAIGALTVVPPVVKFTRKIQKEVMDE